jgi:pimeloyl-ACP methyl ester carboxylesterase
MGTVPADKTPPRFHAVAAERALSMLAADCAHDPECAKAFGDVGADVAAASDRLSGEDAELRRALFMEKVRALLYSTAGQRRAPFVLHRAAMGDFGPFEDATRKGADSSFADGLYLSMTCAESFPDFDADAAMLDARRTRFGDYRIARQREACQHWPVGPTVQSDTSSAGPYRVPVLFVAGDMDPVSPPQWAVDAQAVFPDSRYVLVPQGGHVLDGMSGLDTCFDRVVIELFDSGSVQGLDTSCFATMQPGPYQTRAAQ